MFWTEESIAKNITELEEIDAAISDLRKQAAVVVNRLNKAGVAGRYGARSIVDWLSAKLDMSRARAGELVFASRFGAHRDIERRLVDGEISFDRAMSTLRLAEAGASDDTVRQSYQMDVGRVAHLTARQQRLGRSDEQRVFNERYFSLQPTLDDSSWKVSGRLPGYEGRVVEKAFHERAEEFRHLPYGETSTRGQRQADALVVMAQDSLAHGAHDSEDASGAAVAVFVDLDQANGTDGELGASVEYGPRVGPNTIDELLCTGTVQVIGLSDGRPVVTSDAARAIPPAVRHTVADRDGGCAIDGCTSRYRLQPHHIRERRHGGSHDPDNLTTVCWYHHHVAIHGQGFRIDPESPPLRRRLIRPRAGPDPP